jgi:hypothetical protein
MPADRDLEGALSLVTFFGQAKKVTRPPGRRKTHGREPVLAKPHPTEYKEKIKMDSGFRRNDGEEGIRRNDE